MVVYSNEVIENANNAMLATFITAHKLCGTEYIIEDGKIAEIHFLHQQKIIKQQK